VTAAEKEAKREKARKLIKLASRASGTSLEERRSAAMRAVKIISKYKLLEPTPLDGILENDTFRAAKKVADKLTDPELVGGLKAMGQMFKQVVDEGRRRGR